MKKTGAFILFLIFTSVIIQPVSGQGKVDITAGFGIPELLNAGIRFQCNQSQVGLNFGSLPLGPDEQIFSFSTDFHYHFSGTSKLSDRRPWFGRMGMNYLRDKNSSALFQYYYLNARIGREFNFSKRFGIDIDAGAAFQIYHKKEDIKKATNSWINMDIPVIPGIAITFFYRI